MLHLKKNNISNDQVTLFLHPLILKKKEQV